MATTKRYNAIRFVTTDEGTPAATIHLKLTSELVLTPGIEPNVHLFEARWPEVEPIKDDPGRMGSIQFFYSADPSDPAAQPDFELKRMRIVDVETVNFGYIKGRAARSPVTVRLHIADRRELLTFPRGGILDSGEWNKEPFATTSTKDANGRGSVTRAKLVEMCLEKMRLLEEITDGGTGTKVQVHALLSDTIPPNNIAWHGAHAPEELDKLLKEAGFIFWVKSDGTFAINQRHKGELPTLPPDAVEWPCLGIDRRGKTVVLTSHPFPITDTITLKGPNKWYTATETDDLEYVCYDSDRNTWRPVAQVAGDPIDAIRRGYIPDGVDLTSFLSLFRNVRINPLKYPQRMILRKVMDKDAGPAHPRAQAIVPIRKTDGLVHNSTQRRTIAVKQIIDGQILSFENTLGRIQDEKSPAGTYHEYFVPLEEDELEITVTVEAMKNDKDGQPEPEFFYIGFEQKLGGEIRRLEDAELKALLAKPGAVIVPCPELRLIRKGGVDQNLTRIQDWATIVAAGLLRGSGVEAKEYHLRGFAKMELGPRVPEIRISQSGPHMIIRTDAWHFPHILAYTSAGTKPPKKASQERFSHETRTAALRTHQGNSTAMQPSVPVIPSAPPPPAPEIKVVSLEQVGGANGNKTTAPTWTYDVSIPGGGVIMTEATPQVVRPWGLFDPANYGIAYRDLTGIWQLLIAFELEGTGGCA